MEIPKQLLEEQTCEEIREVRAIAGGDINDSYLIKCESTRYFLKCNKYDHGDEMLQTEQDGLNRLGKAGLRVPRVLHCDSYDGAHYLLMEWIPPNKGAPKDMEDAGRLLAQTHQETHDTFGLSRDNYIGPLKQDNSPGRSWPDFYIGQRIEPLVKICVDKKLLDEGYFEKLKKLHAWMVKHGNNYKPSLIHGDLWSGNLLFDSEGKPWFVDPAVSYSEREMDLAMTRLFGGFPLVFYSVYQEVYPLTEGFEERVAMYQLYYLLVHLILFGGGYYSGVERSFAEYM